MTVISNGMQKMRFAKPYAPIQEQRIVRPRRFLSHCQTSRMSKPVARANYKGVEQIARIHVGGANGLIVRRTASLVSHNGLRLCERYFIHHRLWFIAVHDKVDRNAGIHNPNKQTADSTGETALQPVTRICVANSDGQCPILIRNWSCVAHPRIERGAWHFHLELPEY